MLAMFVIHRDFESQNHLQMPYLLGPPRPTAYGVLEWYGILLRTRYGLQVLVGYEDYELLGLRLYLCRQYEHFILPEELGKVRE